MNSPRSAVSVMCMAAAAVTITACAPTPVVQAPQPSGRPSRGYGAANSERTLGIPPGQLPPPGSCRIWFPGRPPGHQPAAGRCDDLASRVPPGAWLVYRPLADGRGKGRGRGRRGHAVVRVSVYGDSGLSVVRIFDAVTGALLEEDTPAAAGRRR